MGCHQYKKKCLTHKLCILLLFYFKFFSLFLGNSLTNLLKEILKDKIKSTRTIN